MIRPLIRVVLVILVIVLVVGIFRRIDNRNATPDTINDTEPESYTPNTTTDPSDSPEDVPTTEEPTTFTLGPGEYEREIQSGGLTRKYLLHVPQSYKPGTPTPIILLYHGGGGTMGQAFREYGWEETSEATGAIVASMNGTSRFPNDILATWNAGSCCGYARDNKIDDVAYTRTALLDIQADFNIKSGAVFATGFSNGGILMHRLACEASDIFSAVVALAGTVGITSCSPAEEIRVMHIHAMDDSHVLYGGGAGEDSFDDPSQVTEFTSVPDTKDFWVDEYALNKTPVRIYENSGAYCDEYTGSPEGGSFTLCVTPDGSHSWPGAATPSRSGAVPTKTLDGNEVIWDFFMGKF